MNQDFGNPPTTVDASELQLAANHPFLYETVWNLGMFLKMPSTGIFRARCLFTTVGFFCQEVRINVNSELSEFDIKNKPNFDQSLPTLRQGCNFPLGPWLFTESPLKRGLHSLNRTRLPTTTFQVLLRGKIWVYFLDIGWTSCFLSKKYLTS